MFEIKYFCLTNFYPDYELIFSSSICVFCTMCFVECAALCRNKRWWWWWWHVYRAHTRV